MKFRYAFQQIVDLKSNEKSMAEWAYAAALGRLRQTEEALRQLQDERMQVENKWTVAAHASVTLAQLTTIQQYLEVLDMRIQRQADEVAAAQTQVEAKRSGLEKKAVDEKVWQNARDKSYELHKVEWLRKQQYELDEMATVRAVMARAE